MKIVGPDHHELAATGDLGTVDTKRNLFFYLGDTTAGTTLVGLSLTDGTEACTQTVPLKEVGFVGIGQSLDYDPQTDELILSGLAGNASAPTHVVLKGPAKGCGPFTKVGEYGVASYSPMIHSSTLDVAGQTLYVLVSVTGSELGVAIIDLKTGTCFLHPLYFLLTRVRIP